VGLATFPPLYTRGTRLLIAAPHTDGVSVSDALHDLFRAPFWPVTLDQVGSELSFADLPSASTEPMRLGGLEVRWMPIPHPGGCTAYRLDEPATGTSLVLATDAEWTTEETDPAFLAFCQGCQLLICDGQYDDDVAPARRGWGHTAWPQAVDLARAAGVGRLLLTHHDPEADDTVLAAREQALQAVMPGAALARQGQSLDLSRKDVP
jgi:ribonuclease BN (tRNA processing enzyme)